MKSLKQYLTEDIIDDFENDENYEEYDDTPTSKDALDIALVMDMKLYSDQDPDFCDRKVAIANTFRKELKELEITTERIEKSKIFDFYIKHLKIMYKQNVSENANLNIASENELRRLISADLVLLIRNIPF